MQAGPEPARMSFSLDGKELKKFDVTAEEPAPQVCELRVHVSAGAHKFSAAYLHNYRNPKNPEPKNPDRHPVIHYLEVDRLLRLFALADTNGESFEQSVKLALEAVLVSSSFLFRGELQPDPTNPSVVQPVDEFALASRLSYFLWSSLPDDELCALAGRKALRKNLEQQVKRMLKDPQAQALVDNFAGQWLQVRNLKLVAPDKNLFPDFDDNLLASMAKETELFFTDIVRQDRSVLEFLDADYTFVDGRLAKLYDLPGITGDDFQRVSLKGTHRGGLLTQASILTVTSTPTRTSPVKRGKWVLENLLGTPPPPPPP